MTNYMRQTRIFDPSQSHRSIVIIGAGGIGSFLTFYLAKMGFKDITVFDGDTVEAHNAPNQLYGMQHVDKPKVTALAGIVKALTDVDIKPMNEMVERLDQLPMDNNAIYVFALDSLEVRQNLYKQMKGMANVLVDGRMGGEMYTFYKMDLDNEEEQKKYEAQLYVTGSEDPCGMRAIIYTLTSLSSDLANLIKRVDAGQHVPFNVTRSMTKYFYLA